MSNNSLPMLEKLVGYASIRQKVISNNISNLSTENFQREEVKFDDYLRMETGGFLKTTRKKHFDVNSIDGSQTIITKDKNPEMASGVNNVDIEKEMADLAENQIMFKFGLRRISSYFKNLQSAIKGGV